MRDDLRPDPPAPKRGKRPEIHRSRRYRRQIGAKPRGPAGLGALMGAAGLAGLHVHPDRLAQLLS